MEGSVLKGMGACLRDMRRRVSSTSMGVNAISEGLRRSMVNMACVSPPRTEDNRMQREESRGRRWWAETRYFEVDIDFEKERGVDDGPVASYLFHDLPDVALDIAARAKMRHCRIL